MPTTNPQSDSTTPPQTSTESDQPVTEPRVNPIFWIMGIVFAVLLAIVFFIINALSTYP